MGSPSLRVRLSAAKTMVEFWMSAYAVHRLRVDSLHAKRVGRSIAIAQSELGHCAYFAAGRFDESLAAAKKALIQNPRFAMALRFLAASLAKQGQSEAAAQVIREVLKIEPQLTPAKLRARSMFMQAGAWKEYSDALRLAGLPE